MFDEIYDDDFTADNTAAADRCLHRHRRPSIRPFVEHHDLDGFDIDYEVPQFTSAQKFKEVAQEVRQAHGPDHLFTITPNNTRNLDGPTLEQHFDYVNVQSYDAKGDEAFSVDDVLGLPASMVLAGADIENPNSYRNESGGLGDQPAQDQAAGWRVHLATEAVGPTASGRDLQGLRESGAGRDAPIGRLELNSGHRHERRVHRQGPVLNPDVAGQ